MCGTGALTLPRIISCTMQGVILLMSPVIWGVFYALLAALSFALWNIYLERGLASGGGTWDALFALATAEVICFLPVSLWLTWKGAGPPLRLSGLLWFFVAGTLTSVVGAFLATRATHRIGAVHTTAIRLLDPLFALIITSVTLQEQLSGRSVAGIVLVGAALLLVQKDAGNTTTVSNRRTRRSGLLYAVLTSLVFTVGSIARKAGLVLVPSAVIAAAVEGIAGIIIVGAVGMTVATRTASSGISTLRPSRSPDLWLSGLAAAAGTLFLNLALQRTPVPIAVALRNTSPWFALALIPLLLGSHRRPTHWIISSTALLSAGMILIVLR